MLGIDLRYEAGKNNDVADALSRMKNEKEKVILTTQIIKEQDENLLSRTIKEFIEEKFLNGSKKQVFILFLDNLCC